MGDIHRGYCAKRPLEVWFPTAAGTTFRLLANPGELRSSSSLKKRYFRWKTAYRSVAEILLLSLASAYRVTATESFEPEFI
jgi:hypothetical protein